MPTKVKDETLKEIEIELEDRVFLFIAKKAHEADMTFNQFCNKILEEVLDDMDNDRKNIKSTRANRTKT